MNYVTRIKETRIDRDITQKEIANILNITQQQYSLYESGKREMPIEILRKFCLFFQISSDYLLDLPTGLSRPR